MRRGVLYSVVLCSIFGLFAGSVQALILPVYGISDLVPANQAIGEAQITIGITNGDDEVIFTFYNDGPTVQLFRKKY